MTDFNLSPTPAPRRKPKRWPWIVAGVVGVFVIIGVLGTAGKDTTKPTVVTAAPVAPATDTAQPTGQVGAGITSVVTPPTPDGPVLGTTAKAGRYEVGVDLAPGKYKTPGASFCAYALSKDANGNELIAVENVNDGQGVAEIKNGQYFKVFGSCVWEKVG